MANALSHIKQSLRTFASLVLMAMLASTALAQSGHVLNGVGPVDQGMAGAGMAATQDAVSTLHWNPAGITNLIGDNVEISIQLLQPTGALSSSVNQGAFGPFGPGANLQGSTDSEAGPFPIPAIGYVHASDASPWAFGLSAFGVGGFGVEYERTGAQGGNPVLMPQPPNGLGFGAITSEFALMQVAPTAAYRFANGISIGVAPTLNYASLEVSPFPAASPDDANGDGFPSYTAAPKDWTPGFGFQASVNYASVSGANIALSFKSRQAFSDFEFNSVDEAGAERLVKFNLDYPMIVSAGLAYTGVDRLLVAADVRYIDFENTDGFSEHGFDQTGAVKGFGWNSILVGALGVQYEVAPGFPVRVGYSYSENPIDADMTFFNTPSPAIIQHHISGGASFAINQKVDLSVAVQYGVKNSIEGKWCNPADGFIPGTMVSSELSTLTFVGGLNLALN